MKRYIALFFSLICIITVAGCSNATAIGNQPILTEPPKLTISTLDNSIEALRGTTSWLYDNGDGTQTGIESDSMHPLDSNSKKYMPTLLITPTPDFSKKPLEAVLQFDVSPDEVSVHCWSDKHWGNTSAESEDILVNDFAIELKDSAYIYEVIARWSSSEKYGGTAYYSFYATDKIKTDVIPMVMVKGELYYDTGKESEIDGRCGVMDGEITSSVDGSEIPTEDNQSNFGTGYEYQMGTEGGIEISINNKWFVFEKRGGDDKIVPNPGVAENMSKTENIIVNNLAGVSIEIKDNTLSNKGLTIAVNNESEHDLIFGSFYCIEKEVDENWYKIPYPEQEHPIGWDDIAYEVLSNSSYEFEATNWEWLYGTLEAGRYRFIKNAFVSSSGDTTDYYFAVEFSLAE